MGSVWDARRRGEGSRSLRKSPGRRRQGGERAVRCAASVMFQAKQRRGEQNGKFAERSWSMNISPGLRPVFVPAALVPLLLAIQPSWVDARAKDAKTQRAHLV